MGLNKEALKKPPKKVIRSKVIKRRRETPLSEAVEQEIKSLPRKRKRIIRKTVEEIDDSLVKEEQESISARPKQKVGAPKKRISDKRLLDIVTKFCFSYAGRTLFQYQQQLGRRVIRTVVLKEGTEVTALQARQSGKTETIGMSAGGLSIILPILANLPMFEGDERLEGFKEGLMVGIFAPTFRQSKILFRRIKMFVNSKTAQEIMQSPDINVDITLSNGDNIGFSCGSSITCKSADANASIEGESYHLIIVDEAQAVGDFMYEKSISPMGAWYNASKILIGTAYTVKGFFYNGIERNKNMYANKEAPKNHYEYSWKVVIKYNPEYHKYILKEIHKLGEESDAFQMSYNLKWVFRTGMFITDKGINEILDGELDFVYSDLVKVHTAGIDFAGKSDSTVITIIEVDYENPVLIEETDNMGIDDFYAYDKKIKWIEELFGEHEEQFQPILEVLNRFNIVNCYTDGTGLGAPITSRLQASCEFPIEAYVFSKPSKSKMYTFYSSELKTKRLKMPNSLEAQNERVHQQWVSQHKQLQKSYSGEFMVVTHPPTEGARDDYPDSTALAVMASNKEVESIPVVENVTTKSLIRRSRVDKVHRRNKVTGRRRA